MQRFHLDHSVPAKKVVTFCNGCPVKVKDIRAIYQDQFGKDYCGRQCFIKHNPPKEASHVASPVHAPEEA